METLQRDEKKENIIEPNFIADFSGTVIAFPIKSNGLVYSELISIIKAGGVRATPQK